MASAVHTIRVLASYPPRKDRHYGVVHAVFPADGQSPHMADVAARLVWQQAYPGVDVLAPFLFTHNAHYP